MSRVLMLLMALTLAGPAFAQDEPAAAPEASDDEAAPGPDATTVEMEDASATSAERALEGDLAKFWGSRRKVKVVQKRLFEKDGRLELTPYGGVVPNDDFIVYIPVGARVGYHFSEAFTVEGSFAYAIEERTDLATFLEEEKILKRADIQEIVKMYYNVNLLWSPIYGKISLLGLKLSHFETYFGLGFGLFHIKEIPAINPTGNDVTKLGGNTVFGFRWFITDMINFRTDYRQYFFEKFKGGVSIPVELTLGVGITI
jgi:outer membrane beta-barrel protein